MKKRRTWLWGCLGIVLAIGLFVVITGATILGSLSKSGLEKRFSQITGVEATLQSTSAKLFQGQLTIDQLTLGNPSGFTSEYALRTGKLQVQLQPRSLWEKVLKVDRLKLDQLEIVVEQQLLRNNLKEILETVQQFQQDRKARRQSFEIGQLTIQNIDTRLIVRILGQATRTFTAEIPDVDLQNVTSDNLAEITLEQLIAQLVSAALGGSASGESGPLPDLLPQLIP